MPKWYLIVRCPNCGKLSKTRSVVRKRCPHCGTCFQIYTRKPSHRIVKCVGITPEEVAKLYTEWALRHGIYKIW